MNKMLTKDFARKNVGKYIDCFNRFARGEYPIQIIKFPSGELGYKRVASGVCSPIDEELEINKVYYDYIFDNLELCKEDEGA